MVTKDEILDKLREVKDPELGINIVDLGLIYEVDIEDKKVLIKMTFTTPACPMMNYMLMQVKERLEELPDLEIEIDIVFDPPWSPERLSEKAKLKLGII
jgi:metal-sulfur cluster biosynthetic enzyme